MAAIITLPSLGMVAAEAAPVSGATSGGSGTAQLYAKLQRMAASTVTDSDESDTNFTARRAEFLVWERAAQLQNFVKAVQAKQAAEAAEAERQRQAALAAQQAQQQATFYRGVQEQAQQRANYALPDSGVLTQGYGGPGGHPGIDIAGPYGSPVLAAANGVVAFAGQQSGYGNFIEIQDADGTYTAYGHLASFNVSVGQQVSAGQQIAQEGSTGESTGPHLHFEVRTALNGATEDPLAWLNEHGITVNGQG